MSKEIIIDVSDLDEEQAEEYFKMFVLICDNLDTNGIPCFMRKKLK